MSSIKLTFRNKSNDVDNTDIVMFQRLPDASVNEDAIAWKVIQNCSIGDFNPFLFPMTQQVTVVDAWGNYMPTQDANNGDVFSVAASANGDKGSHVLVKTRERGDPNMITVRNDLAKGSIDIVVYKDERRIAMKTGVTPGEESVFELQPYLYIGTCSQVDEDDVMNSDTIQGTPTKLSLLGLKSADIEMTGGGTGRDAVPFAFTLKNQRYN